MKISIAKYPKSVGLLALALSVGGVQATPDNARGIAYEAMPPGITLQPLGMAQGYGPQRLAYHVRSEIVYANAQGMTLYTYDRDRENASVCAADCLKEWAPEVPLPKAKAAPQWNIITRADGIKQWAYKGKPLYTSVKDKEPGEIGGGGIGAGKKGDPTYGYDGPVRVQLPEGWRPVMFQTGGVPGTDVVAPPGLALREVVDANGVSLVDSRQMTVYAYDASLDNDTLKCKSGPCADHFLPVVAPQLAEASNDWSFADRRDGIHQWVYRGKPLYTYSGDLVPGDVYGNDIDSRWRVAMIATYFQPASVKLRRDPGLGLVMTDTKGITLYHRDVQAFIPGSRQTYHDHPYRPRVGRSIRNTECLRECAQQFRPFLAADDATPHGYWGVALRFDGKKQWTYKDFALYTFNGDKKPGDMNANNIYDLNVSDDPKTVNDVGYPVHSGAGMFWMYSGL